MEALYLEIAELAKITWPILEVLKNNDKIRKILEQLQKTKLLNSRIGNKTLCFTLREYPEFIKILLENNVDFSYKDIDDNTVLHGIKSIDSAKLFLENINCGNLILSKNIKGKTVLHCVTSAEMINLFLIHGANVQINALTIIGRTSALHVLHDCNHLQVSNKPIALILLRNGIDINLRNSIGNVANILTQFSIIELLKFGINLNLINLKRETVLMFLIKHDMDLSKHGSNKHSIFQKSIGEKNYFSKNAIDINHVDMDGNNLLHYSNVFNIQAFRELLISTTSYIGQGMGQDMIQDMVQDVTPINNLNNNGDTPLHISTNKAHIEILIQYGANVNIQNSEGNISQSLLRHFTIRELINFGVDMTIKNNKNQTVLMLIVQTPLSTHYNTDKDIDLIEYFKNTIIPDINHRDYLGNNILCYISDVIIAKALINRNPNISLILSNYDGYNAIQVLFRQKMIKNENLSCGINVHRRYELLKILLFYSKSIEKYLILLIQNWNKQFKEKIIDILKIETHQQYILKKMYTASYRIKSIKNSLFINRNNTRSRIEKNSQLSIMPLFKIIYDTDLNLLKLILEYLNVSYFEFNQKCI